MVLTCECCPCSRTLGLRVCCMVSTCTLAFTWWIFVVVTVTEDYYDKNNTVPFYYTPTISYYTPNVQAWYIVFGTLFYVIISFALLSLIIFWFCWNDGKRCFSKMRERIALIILTIFLVISILWVIPAVLLESPPPDGSNSYYYDNEYLYVLYTWTVLLGVCGGGCLVVTWYQNCKKIVVNDVVHAVPKEATTQYTPPELEDTVLPWLMKKGEITNNWELVHKYYRKSIDDTNKKFSAFIQLFFTQMGGNDIIIKEIFAVHNPTLFDQFNNRRKVMLDRQKDDPNTWLEHQWPDNDHQKAWVYESYQNLVKSFKWNDKNADLPIIPVLHGTDEDIAWKICRSGFAALARLDAGWYGAGNYFSTNAMYCFPYFGTKNNPALILSFVIPGNIYPVTEDKDGPDSLLGKPIRKRCGSHYVLVTKDGLVCKHVMERDYFTEIVVEQEAQILPSFVFLLDRKNFQELAVNYQRDIPKS